MGDRSVVPIPQSRIATLRHNSVLNCIGMLYSIHRSTPHHPTILPTLTGCTRSRTHQQYTIHPFGPGQEKTELRTPPSCGRAFKTSQPVLHECVNQQFLQSDQQISRTTIIAHSTCLWARIHRPGCSVNNPGNSLKRNSPHKVTL